MNQFFLYWVDLAAMVLSLIIALFFTIRYKRSSIKPLRAVPLFFLLFGPLVIIVHMGFHNFEILYRAIQAGIAGTFTYSFRFYSLMLMGMLVLWLSVVFLKQSAGLYVWGSVSRKQLLQTAGIIALVTLPTIPLTPIGSLPLMACIINLTASAFVRKSKVVATVKPLMATERVESASISTGA